MSDSANQRRATPSHSEPPSLSACSEMLLSSDKSVQFDGLVQIRKLLSTEHQAPIDEVIASGNVPKILEFMNWDTDPKFQVESAWVITNICSGTTQHVEYILQIGGLNLTGKLLESESADVVEQATWIVGNISGDSTQYRDICLNKGFMDKLIAAVARFSAKKTLVRNAVWCVSNLVRGKPAPPYEQVGIALPLLSQMITANMDQMVLNDALWGIAYLAQSGAKQVISFGCVPQLIQYLGDKNWDIAVVPALKALGRLVSGDEEQTEAVLNDKGFLPTVFDLASRNEKPGKPGKFEKLKKNVFWVISNITAGNSKQIQRILDVPEYMEALKQGLSQPAKKV